MRIFFLVLCCLCSRSFGVDIPWKPVLYSHYSNGEPLVELLQDFFSTHNIQIIPSEAITSTINGTFVDEKGAEFLKKLAVTYNLLWYYDGTVVYLYPSYALDSKVFVLQHLSPSSFESQLKQLGILDKRYPFRITKEGSLFFVAGPPRYLDLLAQSVELMDVPTAQKQLKIFFLKHAWAEDRKVIIRGKEQHIKGIASLLKELLAPPPAASKKDGDPAPSATSPSSSGIFISSDSRMNAIIVRDDPRRFALYEDVISLLDAQTALIEIEVTILDINVDKAYEAGVDWRHYGEKHNIGYGTITSPNPSQGTLAVTNSQFSTILSGKVKTFLAKIKALETHGNSHVLSRPTIVTTNNMQAVFDYSGTFYVKVSGEQSGQLVPVSAGVMVKVTPRLTEEKKDIKLAVSIEDGSISQQPALEVESLPRVNASTINTEASVQIGESLVIGGYYREEESQSVSRFPLLGYLPVIELFFSSRSRKKVRMERVFIITPRIVKSSHLKIPSTIEDIKKIPNP